jgi:hypothetical protein
MEESLHVGKVSSTPLMFPIANLERKFRVGDNVRVLADSIEALNLKGKTGIVVEVGIEDNSVVVYDHTSQSQASDSIYFVLYY